MNVKKHLLFFIGFLSLLFVCISSGCEEKYMYSPKSTDDLLSLIEEGNVHDLTLTIYYMELRALTPTPIRLNQLIDGWYDHRVVVSGEELAAYCNLLSQLIIAPLAPVDEESFVNARLYYVFEHVEYGELFSFLAFSGGDTMFVNGLEVEYNSIFFEAVLPFLPDDAFETIERYINTMRQRPVHHRHP